MPESLSTIVAGPASATPAADDPRLARVVEFFEQLCEADVARLDQVYTGDARFKDPFNTLQGPAAIGRVFGHMFKTLDDPRFVVLTRVQQGDDAFLTWDFRFRTRGLGARALCIHGASHLQLDHDGRIRLHRDYWDAAEELYQQLPVLGSLMRWLQRRLAV